MGQASSRTSLVRKEDAVGNRFPGDVDLLFLDVDGVLNNRASREDGDHMPTTAALDHLEYLVQTAHQTRIVLSSTWRLDAQLRDALVKMFGQRGLAIYSQTPDLEATHRGDREHHAIEPAHAASPG
jgi:hypothetical protein